MSRENVKKFYDLVENDASLKKELEGLDEKIKVSQTDLNNLRGLVKKEIIPVAKKRGLDFTAEELLTYANDKYMKLTEEDLMDISGGISAKNSAIGLSAVLLLSLGSTAAINLLTPNNNLNQSISSSKPKDTSEEKNDDVDNKVDNKNDDVNNKVDKKDDNSRNANNDNNSRDLKLAKNELEALKNKEIEVPNVRRNVEDNAGGNSSNNVKEFNNETIIKQNPEYNMQNSNQKQAKTLKDFLEEVLRVQKEKAAGAAKNDTTANFSGENSKEETREKQVKDDHNSNEDVNQKEEIKAQSNVGEQETRFKFYYEEHPQNKTPQEKIEEKVNEIENYIKSKYEQAKKNNNKRPLEKDQIKKLLSEIEENISKDLEDLQQYEITFNKEGIIFKDDIITIKDKNEDNIESKVSFKELINSLNKEVEEAYNKRIKTEKEAQKAADASKKAEEKERTERAKKYTETRKQAEEEKAKKSVDELKAKIIDNIGKMYNQARQDKKVSILSAEEILKLAQSGYVLDGIVYDGNIDMSINNGNDYCVIEIKYNNKELDVTQEDKLDVGKVLNDLNKKAAAEQKEQNKNSEAKLKEQAKNAVSDAKTKLNDAIKNRIYDAKKTDKSTEKILDDVTKNVELDENIVIDKNGNRWTIKYKLQEVVIAQDTINIDKTIKDLTKIVSNEITKEAQVAAKVTERKIQEWVINMYKEAVTNNNKKPLNVKAFLYSIDPDKFIGALPKDDFRYTFGYDYENITIKVNGLDVIERLNVKELVNNWNDHTKQVYKQAEKEKAEQVKKEKAEQIRKEAEAKNDRINKAQAAAEDRVGIIEEEIQKMYQNAVINNDNKPLNVEVFLKNIDLQKFLEALPEDKSDFKYEYKYDSDHDCITIKVQGLDVICKAKVKELVNVLNNNTKQVYKQAEKEKEEQIKKEKAEQIRKEAEAKKQAELEAKQKAEAQRKAEKEKAEQVRKETEAKKQAEQAKENLKSSYSGLTGITTARVTAANNLAEFLYNNVNINKNDSKQEIKEKIEKNVKLTDMEQLINDINEIRSYISGNEQDGYSIRRSGVIAHLPFTAKEDNIETANAKLIINVYDALN